MKELVSLFDVEKYHCSVCLKEIKAYLVIEDEFWDSDQRVFLCKEHATLLLNQLKDVLEAVKCNSH